jgi:ParB-like chromosome segregation protein Spo0J
MVEDVPITDLLASPLVDPQRHLDADRVQRYALILDELPPVTVFRLDEDQTLLLADGYHRLAAARMAGRSTLRADVRGGTRADALHFAVELAVQEQGISEQQARAAIVRFSRKDER